MKTTIKLLLSLLITQSLIAKEISYSIDNKPFQAKSSVYVTPAQKLTLKFDVQNAKSIKWYQIIPDTSKFYKNANHPWEKNPYQWSDYGTIDYARVEISSFENQSKVMITQKILEENRPQSDNYYNSTLGSFWFEVEATLANGKSTTK
ncbi:MAG: hypothetical protein Q9M36_13645 [Sulfurovum sp.]|nr:hypothetical protein [Sulfurovum sp.]